MQEIHQAKNDSPPRAARTTRPRWALVAAPVAVLAVAAGVVVTVSANSGSKADSVAIAPTVKVEPASAKGATAFLQQVADAAAKQKAPTAQADQFVFVRSKVGFTRQVKQRTTDGLAKLDAVHDREVWLAQNPSKDGLIREGGDDMTLHALGDNAQVDGKAVKNDEAEVGTESAARIAELPTDPGTLLKKIYADTKGDAPGKDAAAFNWIGEAVGEQIVPSDVAAAIWKTAAEIPGVVLVKDSTDAAGRHGEAIAYVSNGERTEYIFDATTHLYLGERSYLVKDTAQGKAGMLTGTTAVLSRGVVDKIGTEPDGKTA